MKTVRLLAISGSTREASTNTALLASLAELAPPGVSIELYRGLAELPIFSPDRQGGHTPPAVLNFARQIASADALIIACPEYVHAMPGGLKNAIDWMVGRPELVGKPIALAHASHRGDEMLHSLRRVLATVSDRFMERPFFRENLLSLEPQDVRERIHASPLRARAQAYLAELLDAIGVSAEPTPP